MASAGATTHEAVAAQLQAISTSVVSEPIKKSLQHLAGYAKGDWPSEEGLGDLSKLGNELKALESDFNDMLDSAIRKTQEAEEARTALQSSMAALADRTAEALSSSALLDRVTAMESNMQKAADAHAAESAALKAEVASLQGAMKRQEAEMAKVLKVLGLQPAAQQEEESGAAVREAAAGAAAGGAAAGTSSGSSSAAASAEREQFLQGGSLGAFASDPATTGQHVAKRK